MNIFTKMFKKKEEKSQTITSNYLQVVNAINECNILGQTNSDPKKRLKFMDEIFFYLVSKPVADAVDLISEKFSMITPVLIDDKSGEITHDHDLLRLLNNPNKDDSMNEFLYKYAAFYLITGNSFLNAFGNVNFAPNELDVLLPTGMSFEGKTRSSEVVSFTYTAETFLINYLLDNTGKNNRYINAQKTAEFWHVKGMNPLLGASDPYGISIMNAIQLEIEQHLEANKHNLSLLSNGARLGGILSTEGNLSKDQREFIKTQFNELYKGASNSGKMLFTEGGGGKMSYNELAKNAKDMDFSNLKRGNKLDIYSRYKVPLPLVSPDHMTMDNYSEAKLALWDDAVMPLANRLLGELQKFLFPRYKNLEGQTLSFDMQAIPALKKRENASVAAKRELNIFSINEIRAQLGHDPISGGDELYQPGNLIPLGANLPGGQGIEKSRFAQVLKNSGFNESEVTKSVNEHYGNE